MQQINKVVAFLKGDVEENAPTTLVLRHDKTGGLYAFDEAAHVDLNPASAAAHRIEIILSELPAEADRIVIEYGAPPVPPSRGRILISSQAAAGSRPVVFIDGKKIAGVVSAHVVVSSDAVSQVVLDIAGADVELDVPQMPETEGGGDDGAADGADVTRNASMVGQAAAAAGTPTGATHVGHSYNTAGKEWAFKYDVATDVMRKVDEGDDTCDFYLPINACHWQRFDATDAGRKLVYDADATYFPDTPNGQNVAPSVRCKIIATDSIGPDVFIRTVDGDFFWTEGTRVARDGAMQTKGR